MSELQFNSVSVNKLGQYRWFQSKHEIVNRLVQAVLLGAEITISKQAWKDTVNEFEKILNLSPTEDPR